jgi:hypothetical protein
VAGRVVAAVWRRLFGAALASCVVAGVWWPGCAVAAA